MSLKSKVTGILFGVFSLYVLATFLALTFVHIPIYKQAEKNNAADQLMRVNAYIEAERADIDLLVIDWAQWDDTMEYVLGNYPEYYDDNLAGGYLGELGMSFAAIFDRQDRLIWGEAYTLDGSLLNLDSFFPQGIEQIDWLLRPSKVAELISGLIKTSNGPAIVSSAAILWNSGDGPPGGHLIVGKVLDVDRLNVISKTMLSETELLDPDVDTLSPVFEQAYNRILDGNVPFVLVEQEAYVYGLSLIRDLAGQPLGMLRVAIPANISILGKRSVFITITTLVLAALILTLTLWIALKRLLLLPIEQLTHKLQRSEYRFSGVSCDQYLFSTIRQLKEPHDNVPRRSDEVGVLMRAFDDLCTSLFYASEKVWRAAHTDGLTGLANRRLFIERMEAAVGGANAEDDQQLSIFFVDLDDFKRVNDTLGHRSGDQLLMEVASRLQAIVGKENVLVRQDDNCMANLVARIGGDEFVVILARDPLKRSVDEVAVNIVEAMATPFLLGNQPCTIGACVGVAMFPEDSAGCYGLLNSADAAMYEAKRAGKGRWRRCARDAAQSIGYKCIAKGSV